MSARSVAPHRVPIKIWSLALRILWYQVDNGESSVALASDSFNLFIARHCLTKGDVVVLSKPELAVKGKGHVLLQVF
jgi:hypothetical protein